MVQLPQRRSPRFDGVGLLLAVCAGSIREELGGLGKLESLLLSENKLAGEVVRACQFGLACGLCLTKSRPDKQTTRLHGLDDSVHDW